MRSKQETISGKSATSRGCCHYWVVEPATYSTSIGVCRICGEKREFRNDLFLCLKRHSGRHRDGSRPVRLKGRGNGSEKGAQSTHGEYTIEDFRRWGRMGGRGNKKEKEA